MIGLLSQAGESVAAARDSDPGAGSDVLFWVVYLIPWAVLVALAAVSFYGLRRKWHRERRWFGWVLGATATLAFLGIWDLVTRTVATNSEQAGMVSFAMGMTLLILWGALIARGVIGLALRLPWTPLAIARTVLDEAVRMRIVVLFVVLLALVVPFLPLTMSAETPLRYRVQQFLGWSMGATTLCLGLLTIFLACSTLASEMRDKQIYLSAVKPVSRGTYLLGKWIGICLLNAILIGITGLMIWMYTLGFLAQQEPVDWYDGVALKNQVLTARESRRPEPPPLTEQDAERWLAGFTEANENRQQVVAMLGGESAVVASIAEYGVIETEVLNRLAQQYQRDPTAIEQRGGVRRYLRELRGQTLANWWSIPPRQRLYRTFVVDGLSDAKQRMLAASEAAEARGEADAVGVGRLQLQYKVTSGVADGTPVQLDWGLNDRFYQTINAPTGITQVLPIPAQAISDEGVLHIDLINRSPLTITFPPQDGMVVMYPVGSFTPNLFRGVLILWLKLAFLAILGLTCATFLGFPVASLLSLLVFFGSMMSGFVLESMVTLQRGEDYAWYQHSLMYVGWLFAQAVERYGQFSPASLIVEGRIVHWRQVGAALIWIGVVWSGAMGLIGWWIFQKRELAKVQV